MKNTLILLSLLVVGCGEPVVEDVSAVQQFLGSWSFALRGTLSCPGDDPKSGNVTEQQRFVADDEPNHIVLDDGCSIRFVVAGSTATLAGAQSCMSGSLTQWSSGSLAKSDGNTLTETLVGTVVEDGKTCSYSVSGTGTKAP